MCVCIAGSVCECVCAFHIEGREHKVKFIQEVARTPGGPGSPGFGPGSASGYGTAYHLWHGLELIMKHCLPLKVWPEWETTTSAAASASASASTKRPAWGKLARRMVKSGSSADIKTIFAVAKVGRINACSYLCRNQCTFPNNLERTLGKIAMK